MRPDDRLSEWIAARRTADVPAGFTDRVVAAATDRDVTAVAMRDRTAAAERRHRALHFVVVALAGVVGAARIAAALAVFFPQ